MPKTPPASAIAASAIVLCGAGGVAGQEVCTAARGDGPHAGVVSRIEAGAYPDERESHRGRQDARAFVPTMEFGPAISVLRAQRDRHGVPITTRLVDERTIAAIQVRVDGVPEKEGWSRLSVFDAETGHGWAVSPPAGAGEEYGLGWFLSVDGGEVRALTHDGLIEAWSADGRPLESYRVVAPYPDVALGSAVGHADGRLLRVWSADLAGWAIDARGSRPAVVECAQGLQTIDLRTGSVRELLPHARPTFRAVASDGSVDEFGFLDGEPTPYAGRLLAAGRGTVIAYGYDAADEVITLDGSGAERARARLEWPLARVSVDASGRIWATMWVPGEERPTWAAVVFDERLEELFRVESVTVQDAIGDRVLTMGDLDDVQSRLEIRRLVPAGR